MYIYHLSQQQFATLEPNKKSAVIFIDNPPGYTPDISEYGCGIFFNFWDYEPKSFLEKQLLKIPFADETLIKIGQNIFHKTWRPIFYSDAKKIKAFVLSLPADIDSVICVCEFGRSRSRAVAEYLAAYYGVESVGDKSFKPNQWVLSCLNLKN